MLNNFLTIFIQPGINSKKAAFRAAIMIETSKILSGVLIAKEYHTFVKSQEARHG